jgi:hypothetical protein
MSQTETTTLGAQGARRPIIRKLPGIAGRSPVTGEIHFIRGVICYASPRVQAVETDSKIYRLIHLLGSTYLFWCDACHATVYNEEVMREGSQICPFCRGVVLPLDKGTKVRLHYRFAPNAEWADWWAEKWDW